MASRKNLVLASLVSLVMVLSFGIGLVPMLTVGPDQSAKAAPGAAEVAISVDGTTPVGASYAIPVGGEQGFSALRLVGDGVESLGGGTVEWSLATDGSAKLVSAADAAVATVQALAPGEASLYARTSDGLVAIVDLTFYELTAIPQLNGTTVVVTSPLQGARIVVPAGEVTPLTLTAETSNPADVQRVRYVLDAAGTIVAGYSESAPYAVVIPDVLALTNPFVRAEAFSTAAGQYVESTGVTFTVVPVPDADGAGDLDPNGIPDDPFGAGLNPGDQWTSTITDGTFDRTVGMTFLGGAQGKAIVLPEDGVTVTLADPDDATRWVRVTAPAGLVQAGQQGMLLVAIADTPVDLLGATEAANLAVEPSTLVTNGQYVSVNVLIQEGSAWTSLTDVTDNPVVVEMGGLGVTANESAAFAVHPSTAVETGGDTEIQVAPGGSWAKTESGSVVELGEMSAELGTLGVVAPYEFALSPNILSITPATVSSLGGEIRIALENVTNGQAVAVTIAGQVVNGTVDTDGQGTGVTIAVPASAPLATVAATASADVRVDIDGDFDALTGALTYQGPQITNVNPATGGPGETITITGTGFQNAPGTTVLFGDVALTIDSISATEIVGHFGNIIPADGAVDVVVTNANNFSGTLAAGFVVGVDGPVLTDVEPESVYSGAEYALNLFGQNFIPSAAKQQQASAAVYFTTGQPDTANDTPAASITSFSDTVIRAKTPASLAPGTYSVYVATVLYTAGEADTVQVSNPLTVNLVDPANAQIQVTSVTPEEGPLAGGTLVTIEAVQAVATAYAEYMKVFFGADEGTIQSASATQIVALTPASTFPSLVDVRVENSELAGPDNFGILADGFEYVQPVLSVSPLSAFSATGPVGGPLNLFTPGSKDYTVTNTGTGTLQWAAIAAPDWLNAPNGSGSLAAGESVTQTVSLNSNVTLLAEGTYNSTITFEDNDVDTPDIVIPVSLTVGSASGPILGVSPATDLVSTGGLGGPFSPTDIDYTVSNTGGGTLNWTASADQAWVTVAPGSGSSTTTATTVNVSINSGANSLAPGLHTATVTFSDGTVQVTRQVELTVVAPVIGVVPETNFDAFGPAGGPFAPLSQTYRVYNFGSGELIWDANLVYTGDAPTWLTLEKDVNAQPGTVVASINDNAGLLTGSAAGTTYSATIQFTGNGGTTTRTVTLTVYARPSLESVAPISVGPPTGGLSVYLTGTGFSPLPGAMRVFFTAAQDVQNPAVDVQGTNVMVLSDTLIRVDTPVHVEGDFNVYVQSSINTQGGLIEQVSEMLPFIFAAPTLNVDDVDPAAGPIEGGTQVTITGSNLPDAAVPGKNKQVVDTSTTFRLADAIYNIYGTYTTVRVDLSLLRGPEADPANGPASITGSLLFDPAVLEFVSVTRNIKLRDWYSKSIDSALDQYDDGKVNFVISGGTTEITTFDNQIPNSDEEPHNPNDQLNPFPLGFVTFRVLQVPSVPAVVAISDLAMVDSDAVDFPNFVADDGSVRIIGTAADLQLEDQTVNENDETIDVQVNLFRPDGSNLLRGPNSIEFGVKYDASILTWLGVDPSTQLVDWYEKGFTVVDVDEVNGIVTLLISDAAKVLAEITTVEPGTSNQLNPFPLGTLRFGKKQGALLGAVEPFEVVALEMLDKDSQPFPGEGGVGELGTITVTEMPQVFFGAKEAASVQSSTSTQIVATTPAGDRRETVDVLVVDPSQPGPGNYGFKADSFTYEQPGIGVTPLTDFLSSSTINSTVFSPASAQYQIYNVYNGTLNWTAAVDQSWVTLDAASGTVVGSESDTLTVTINATAAALGQGTHVATITFGGNGGTTTRQVILTITGEAQLAVDPATGVEFAGVPGGPFLPASRAFSVYNSGDGNVDWTVTDDVDWLNLSPASGTNAGTVTVTLSSEAEALGIGTHIATLTFNSTAGTVTRTVTLTILPAGEPSLLVTPETGLTSSGPEGGPFTPASAAFAVYNAGGGQLNYTVTAEATWVTLLNATGTVIGGEFATVTALIDPTVAEALAASNIPLTQQLTFDDGNPSTLPITRTVTLTVFNLTVTAPNGGEEFQRGDDVTVTWTYTGPASNNQVRIELVELDEDGDEVDSDILSAVHSNQQGANTFTWSVDAAAELGRFFKIRVQALADNRISDVSNTTFAVIEPVFEVLNPSAGEEVRAGRSITIQWNYYEIGEPDKANELVDIWLYQGDEPVVRIADNEQNVPFDEAGETNEFRWAVPANLTLGPGYRIVFLSSDGQTVLGGMPVGGPGFTVVRGTGGGLGLILAGLIAALLGLAGGGGDGGGGGPCFIATAAYGTPMAAQIDTLRDFRDLYMLSNPLGIAAADLYYQISPAIADVVAKYPVLAALVRLALVPVILVAKLAVSMPVPSMMLAAFGMVMMALRRIRRSRKA